MIYKTIHQQIRRAFSNAAIHYEVLSSMQYEIGRELVDQIPLREGPCSILDVGMGTGKLTNRMATTFPEARVIGVDFAEGMVEQAKKKYESFYAVQADAAALPFYDQQFDVVASNCSYQWIPDLERAFAEARRVLKQNGDIALTLFGYQTMRELFKTLLATEIVNHEDDLRRLPSCAHVQDALQQAGFKNMSVKSEITQTHFNDLAELLRWGKSIGANVLNSGVVMGPRRLAKAAAYYEQHFAGPWGITATFEVIWVKGSYE